MSKLMSLLLMIYDPYRMSRWPSWPTQPALVHHKLVFAWCSCPTWELRKYCSHQGI